VTDPAGRWRLRRRSGLLPPLGFMRKRIAGDRGATLLGPLPLPFRVERRGERVALRYRPPLVPLVDELHPDGPSAYRGRARLGPIPLGRFDMWREGTPPPR